ncbi:MAG: adenylyltransferase/cytidyltransferase family protein [Clostridia bacterium]|nr:adenylyltransferase/cytidyltransferase family protein [Clostridia bacterium]
MKIGFTIGKFAPFHKGHRYLIDLAIKQMDEFYVVVYDTPELNIDINNKIKWIKNEFPDVKILKAFNSPKKYGLDDESVKIQMEYLVDIIKDIPVTHFFSSEKYGECVAKYLDIQNILVDPEREKYNIRAEEVRKDIEGFKDCIPKQVYNDMKKLQKK